jgi:NAD(P)-dependent dehydrogenase (short-subunit alcohol dehydrogenase family)
MTPSPDLTGRTAVVSGVLGKLGTVWTRTLLGAGATVFGIDRTSGESPALREVLAGAPGSRFHLVAADVTDTGALLSSLSACLELAGPPTILVNNAGIDQPPTTVGGTWAFGDIPPEVSAAILDVNALGVLRACQVFGSEMARRGTGSVINIGSLYGLTAPDPRMYDHLPADPPFLKPPAYGMSKAAVGSLTRYLATLWGPSGVRVNTLTPGGVLGNQDPQFKAKFTERVPLRRMAEYSDLTGPLLFLASDMSSYVTGTELLVDGGFISR